MEDVKDLRVWTSAHELTLFAYKQTHAILKKEMYGLTSLQRCASASIGANIAEGCGRRSDAEMKRSLQVARGSAGEVEYPLLLAKDSQFFSADEFDDLEGKVLEVQRMLPLSSNVCRVRF
jgi:four helix bundle protein